MKRVAAVAVVLLASQVAWPAAVEPVPGNLALPPTDIARESNNPAKEAIKAREAQEKEEALQDPAAEEPLTAPTGPGLDNAKRMRDVEEALRNDARTKQLEVALRLDADEMIGLYGSVPSQRSRAAAMEVAAKAAGATRVRNYLLVREKK